MATANEKRALAVQHMLSRVGKNGYTQGSRRKYFFGYPDNRPGDTAQKGYSDCSAAVRAAILAASGVDIGSNTSAQINNRARGMVVHSTDGCYPDESLLLPGDCLYFKGNTSHPLDVGHVEMYTGKNELCGHGSGAGPTRKKLNAYCKSRANSRKRYFMAIRWIPDDAGEKMPEAEGVHIAPGSWNLRSGPGTDYPSVGSVHGGDVLQKADMKDWTMVRVNGRICFIGPKAIAK